MPCAYCICSASAISFIAVPRETEEFVDDMFERLDYTKPVDTGDDILANMRKMEAEVTACLLLM